MQRRLLSVVAIVMMATVAMGTDKRSALMVIDVQNCFTSGGTLEVEDGDEVYSSSTLPGLIQYSKVVYIIMSPSQLRQTIHGL
jgi:hypothetical protein